MPVFSYTTLLSTKFSSLLKWTITSADLSKKRGEKGQQLAQQSKSSMVDGRNTMGLKPPRIKTLKGYLEIIKTKENSLQVLSLRISI